MIPALAEYRRFRRKVLRGTAVSSALAGSVLLPAAGTGAALGLWLGTLAALAVLHLHGADVEKQLGLPPHGARRRAQLGACGRFAVRCGALAPALFYPELSLPWLLVGLLWGQVVLVLAHLAVPHAPCNP